MTGKTAKVESWTEVLPKRMAQLRRTAERRVEKGWEEAVDMLPPAARKAIKRATAEAERVRHDWRKRGDRMVANVRKRIEGAAEDMQKQFEKSVAPLQKRFEKTIEPLQKRIEKSIHPLMERLDVASKKDIDRLQRRVHALERRMHGRGHASPSA
ncbi:MAG: Poly(hydroxyalcanoate) granule associated protein (phasin) [Deltaproteobacteria bacterium]|nr:Poly(hydroxyalcanoate) granule associated protein (phasin) [Deltaproteobacteria bacterium]